MVEMNNQPKKQEYENRDSELIQISQKLTVFETERNRLYNMIKRFSVLFVFVFVLVAGFAIWREITFSKRMARQLSETTYVKDGLSFQGLGPAEIRERYTKLMIRLFDIYGYEYNPYSTPAKAMSPSQKVQYIDFNLKASHAMGFGYYDVPIICLMESSFDPNVDHPYGEIGIAGIKWFTGKIAEKLVQDLPDNLKPLFYFKLNTADDLKDPITACKAVYVLVYFLKKEFQNSEMWAIGMYHWGGFLYRRYYNYKSYRIKKFLNKGTLDEFKADLEAEVSGSNDFPSEFKINGIHYNPNGYYFTWKSLREAFESGDVIVGKPVLEKYKKQQDNMMREEIELQSAQRIIKKLRKEMALKLEIEESLKLKNTELKKLVDESDVKLREVYNVARTEGPEKFRQNFKKGKLVVEEFLTKLDKVKNRSLVDKLTRMSPKNFMVFYTLFVILLVVTIYFLVKSIPYLIKAYHVVYEFLSKIKIKKQ